MHLVTTVLPVISLLAILMLVNGRRQHKERGDYWKRVASRHIAEAGAIEALLKYRPTDALTPLPARVRFALAAADKAAQPVKLAKCKGCAAGCPSIYDNAARIL